MRIALRTPAFPRAMPLDPPSAAPAPAFPRRRLALGLSAAVLLVAAAGALVVARPWTAPASDPSLASALAERLDADSTATAVQTVSVAAGESEPGAAPAGAQAPGEQAAVRAFYDARGGGAAWTDAAARDAALRLLARADRDGLPEALAPGLSDLARAAGSEAPDSLRARLDARLTAAVLRFGRALREPRVDAAALYGAAWTPAARAPLDPDVEARALAADLAATTDPGRALDAFADRHRPAHSGYRLLRAALAREIDLAEAPDLTIRADIAPGDTGAAVRRLRQRLAVESLDVEAAAGREALAAAVRTYQSRQGLPETGRADAATRAALNRRQPETIPALALNLERWRWLPDSLGPLHVLVNIPDYRLVVRERRGARWAEVFRSRVVVGQPSWATPVFSDTMESVVFNPTWFMPASIQIESYGRLRPDRALREPGPGNALGRVKFLFPNDHAVYIHDTPSKWGFEVERRALSHGCVRIGDPQDFATVVLSRTNRWPAARVDSLFTGPWTLRPVALDRGVPVHIAYFTARADAAGRVTLLDDVYGHDARLAGMLGLEPTAARIAGNRTRATADEA